MVLQHYIADAERDPLGDAQTGAVSELQHCAITKRQGLIERRSGEEQLDFVDAQNLRQSAPFFRRLQSLARIAHHVSLGEQEPEIASHRGNVAANRGGGKAEVLEVVDVLAKVARADIYRRGGALYADVGDEAGDVELVGATGLNRGPLFEREEVSEGRNTLRQGNCALEGHNLAFSQNVTIPT